MRGTIRVMAEIGLAAVVLAGCGSAQNASAAPAAADTAAAKTGYSGAEMTSAAGTADTDGTEAEAEISALQTSDPETGSRVERVSYEITYEDTSYEKEAYVYVPASYTGEDPMNILYLMHGSTGSGEQMAENLAPLFDEWILEGSMEPMLVVFPTYYPDETFVVPDYSEDYPLNHFFATSEVNTVMEVVESRYHTYAEGTDAAGLAAGRTHRAFGGYSMGGITTWDVLAYQPQYFAYYMPMAGDCWLDRVTDATSDADIAALLTQGLREQGYTSSDFRILAMVGGNDGTKYAMQPQIEALREDESDLITDENLLYWENEGGGHSEASLEAEVQHGMSFLFAGEDG